MSYWSSDVYASDHARQLESPVGWVEYRLAPENPFPAAVDEGEADARWIAANGKVFGRDFTGLILSGDSAGGNLTLVAAAALRDKPAALPLVMQIPIYPATDFTKRSEEHTSELQSLMRNSYAVFCLKKKTKIQNTQQVNNNLKTKKKDSNYNK